MVKLVVDSCFDLPVGWGSRASICKHADSLLCSWAMSSLGASVCIAVEKTGIGPLKCIQHPYFLADQRPKSYCQIQDGNCQLLNLVRNLFLTDYLGCRGTVEVNEGYFDWWFLWWPLEFSSWLFIYISVFISISWLIYRELDSVPLKEHGFTGRVF